MSLQAPLFRYDLETTQATSSGNRFVDVNCPATGHSFRFYEVEYALACGMDGNRDANQLVDWAGKELGLKTNSSEVQAVIDKCAALGYIDGVAATTKTSSIEVVELGQAGADARENTTGVAAAGAAAVALGASGAVAAAGAMSDAPKSTEPSGKVELGDSGSTAPTQKDMASGVEVDLGASGKVTPDENDPSTPLIDDDETIVAADNAESTIELDDKTQVDDGAFAKTMAPGDVSVTESSLFEANEKQDSKVDASAPVEMADESSVSKPIPKPEKAPAPVSRIQTYEDKQSAPIGLWLLLLGAVGAAGWFLYNNYVAPKETNTIPTRPAVQSQNIDTENEGVAANVAVDGEQKDMPVNEVKAAAPPAASAPLVDGKVRFTLSKGTETKIIAPLENRVAWKAKNGTTVSKGEAVIGYTGFKNFQYATKRGSERLERAKVQLSKAKSDAQKGRIQKNIVRLTETLNDKTTKLNEATVIATQDGNFNASFKGYKKMKAGDELGVVSTPTFWQGAIPKTSSKVGANVVLKSPDFNEKLKCKVARQDESSTWVNCPVPKSLDADSVTTTIYLVVP